MSCGNPRSLRARLLHPGPSLPQGTTFFCANITNGLSSTTACAFITREPIPAATSDFYTTPYNTPRMVNASESILLNDTASVVGAVLRITNITGVQAPPDWGGGFAPCCACAEGVSAACCHLPKCTLRVTWHRRPVLLARPHSGRACERRQPHGSGLGHWHVYFHARAWVQRQHHLHLWCARARCARACKRMHCV